MGYPKKLLSEDESVVLETHPHWKTLVLPVVALLLTLGVSGFLWAVIEDAIGHYVILAVAAIMLVLLFVVPFLRWRTTLFVFTTKRVVVRTGILSRTGRDIPLTRINDVTFTHNLLERMLRCGTLTVESAGERGQVELKDLPHVERVQRELYELVEQAGP